MKRSKAVTLALMGTAAFALAGCEETAHQPQSAAYTGIEQCITAGNTVELCANEYKKAVDAHAAQAPRFASQQECETGADSQCQTTRVENVDGSFSDVFVPLMAGYMISQAVDGIGGARDRRREYGGGYVSTPIYNSRSHSGQSRDLSNVRNLRASTALATVPTGGAASAPSSSGTIARPSTGTVRALPAPNVKTSTISRGGFGKSMGFSSGG